MNYGCFILSQKNYRCFIYIQFNLKINRIYSQDTCWQIDSTIHIGSQFHIKWEYAQELSRSQDQLKLGPCNNRYAQLLTSNRNTLCTHCLIIVKKLKSENALTSSPALSRNFFQVLLNLKNFLVSNLAASSLKLFTLKEVKYLNMFGPTQF